MPHWQTAYITGGGSGIGAQLATRLLASGTTVAIFDRAGGQSVRQGLQRAGSGAGRHFLYQADVSDSAGLEAAVANALADAGPPDLAVNCAGVQVARPFATISSEDYERVIRVNLLGSRNFAAAVLPHMGRGSQLALVASLAGLVPTYGYTAYNASKYGVVGLAGALQLEYHGNGIQVSVICPPEVNTPMVAEERRTMSEAARRLKATAGTLEVGPACDMILAGLQRRKFMVIPGRRARAVATCARLLPGAMRWFSQRVVLANT